MSWSDGPPCLQISGGMQSTPAGTLELFNGFSQLYKGGWLVELFLEWNLRDTIEGLYTAIGWGHTLLSAELHRSLYGLPCQLTAGLS